MLKKDAAICIKASDYSETSQIVTFFTKESGKISTIAKGSKRPKSSFDGIIEVFSFGRIIFSESDGEKLNTLTEFQQHTFSARLNSNLFTLNCCLFASELVNLLTDDYDPHPVLFDNFLRFLKSAQETSGERQATLLLLVRFQLELLKEIGLLPVLDRCANCKTRIEHRVYFSSSANGLICRDCENSFPDKISLTRVTADCLSQLQMMLEAPQQALLEIESILIHHFTEILHKPPRMAKHILSYKF